jgi:hypothetical protein
VIPSGTRRRTAGSEPQRFRSDPHENRGHPESVPVRDGCRKTPTQWANGKASRNPAVVLAATDSSSHSSINRPVHRSACSRL